MKRVLFGSNYTQECVPPLCRIDVRKKGRDTLGSCKELRKAAQNSSLTVALLALLFLGFFVNALSAGTSHAASIGVVAFEGEAAPGLPKGSKFVLIGSLGQEPIINNRGQVAFIATADVPGSGPREGVWAGFPGHLKLVAAQGDVAPGTGGSARFDRFRSIVLADDGQVAMLVDLRSGQIAENLAGIWVGRQDEIKKVARKGEVAPGAQAEFFSFGSMAFNGAQVAFQAMLTSITDGLGFFGIWSGSPSNPALLARSGAPAPDRPPGDTLEVFSFARILLDGDGEALFITRLNLAGIGQALAIYKGKPGALELLAVEGGEVPSLGPGFTVSRLPGFFNLNHFGEVSLSLTMDFNDGQSNLNHHILLAGPPSKLSIVAREGDRVPGSANPPLFYLPDSEGFTFGLRSAVIGRNGEVSFKAFANDLQTDVLMAGPPKKVTLLRKNSEAEQIVINGKGELAFVESPPGPEFKLWTGDPSKLKVAVQTGDAIKLRGGRKGFISLGSPIKYSEAAGGDSEGLPRAIANNGQVVFYSVLDDGAVGLGTGIFVTPATPPDAVRGDFFRDQDADVLWYNSDTGRTEVLAIENMKARGVTLLANTRDTSWTPIAVGNFGGNATADVLWRNSRTRAVQLWIMTQKAGKPVRQATVNLPKLSSRQLALAGIGDFKGNGSDHILWRHGNTGKLEIWELKSSGAFSKKVAPGGRNDLDWIVAGIGDFDNDDNDDILWRNKATGDNEIWRIRASKRRSVFALPAVAKLSQNVAGVGDFDGDNTDDIFWRNTANGANRLWTIIEFTRDSDQRLPIKAKKWEVAKLADYNRDGLIDIFWRNASSGKNQLWGMAGNKRLSSSSLPQRPTNKWQVP